MATHVVSRFFALSRLVDLGSGHLTCLDLAMGKERLATLTLRLGRMKCGRDATVRLDKCCDCGEAEPKVTEVKA